MNHTARHTALLCLLILALAWTWSAPAAAKAVKPNYDKVRNERWRCRSCPFELGTQTRSSITTTALQANDTDARFGRDNGLVDDDGTLDASGTYFSRDEATGRIIGLVGSHLGLDSRRLSLTVRRPGRYAVNFGLREIPRNEWLNALTAVSGKANLRFPSVWTPAPSTPGMTELVPSSRATRIGTQRQRLNLDLAWLFGTRWTLEAGMERETKEGRTLSSGDFLYQATGLLTPVNYTTETLSASLRYQARSWLVGLHLRESEFENAHASLTWQNPYSVGPGASPEGRKALAPDNEASEWGLTFRARPWTGSVLSGHLRWGELRQNDRFLPPSANPAVPPPPIPPPPGLDGQVDTFASNLQWVVPLGSRTTLRLSQLARERDNQTRPLMLMPVLGDRFPGAALLSRHYSFERDRVSAEATFRLSSRTRLVAGVARDERSRSRLEIESNEEDQQWLALRVRMPRSVRLSLRYTDAERDASAFVGTSANNPLTRRYFMAVREQTSWKAAVSAPLGSRLHAGLSLDRRENRYPQSVLGVQQDEDHTWSGDLTWRIAANVHLTLQRSKHQTRSDTAGSSNGGAPDWMSGTRDTVHTTTADLAFEKLFGRANLSISFDHSDGSGRYDTDFNNALSVFPELVSKHRGLDVRFGLPFGERYTAELRYYEERYESADWQLDDVSVDTIPSVISFGLLSPEYDARLVALTLKVQL